MNFPQYVFEPKRIQIRPGIILSYLDEGPSDGPVIVMLHGNPSWSYYWRHLVMALRDRYRCIVPDHVGMGLSDKPADALYPYTLQSRVDDLTVLLERLRILGPVILAVHDWGGMIGFAWALSHAQQVKALVITNTSAFPLPMDKRVPWYIQFGRNWKMGEWCVRRWNAFALGAAYFGVERPMRPDVRRAYTAPYASWSDRIAIIRFMQDIPFSTRDRAWPLVEQVGHQIGQFSNRPTLIAWGLKDRVFDRHFFERFCQLFPKAGVFSYPNAGHYVLEDQRQELVLGISSFLQKLV